MKQYFFICAIISASILLTSCRVGDGFLSASSASNEVLVIMDEDQWEGAAGRALFDVLNSTAIGLPQVEPNFRILQITPENFTNTFKMARNIIMPEISEIYSKGSIKSELDRYARGQVIMTITAPDTTVFMQFVTENKQSIIDYLVKKELERTADWLKRTSGTMQVRLNQMFGIGIWYPKGLPNVMEDVDFFWATNNSPESRQDIVIYSIPYTSETIFEKDSLIALRNRVLGKHIKGQFDSQMTTATKSYDPDYRRIEENGLFRAELRGLWEMTTDMMGGPFVSQAFVNQYTNKVVVVDAFIFAPTKNKRNLMRNMEASFYTIEILNPDEINK